VAQRGSSHVFVPLTSRTSSDVIARFPQFAIEASAADRRHAKAIAETAQRERRRGGSLLKRPDCAQDPADVREAGEVAALMEALRGPW
jgi:hypothetical protein